MPNDGLQDALGKLSPDELQQLHTATYQIKYGKVQGSFDSAKVDNLWNALGPVVARGGGPETGASSLEALHPGITKAASQATGIGPQQTPDLGRFAGVAKIGQMVMGQPKADNLPLLPDESTAAIDPRRAMTPLQMERHPVVTGASKAVAGMTTPENLAVMAASGGAGAIPGVGRALAGGFIASGVGGVVQRGFPTEKGAATEDAVQLAMTAMMARGMRGFEPEVPISKSTLMESLPQAPRTPTSAPSEVPGSRVMGTPEAPTPVPAGPKVTPEPPEAAAAPTLRPEVAQMAKSPTQTPEMRQELIDRYSGISRHPDATPEDKLHAAERLNELGAVDRVVPTISRPVPAARSVEEITKGISKDAPVKTLPLSDAQQLASLTPQAAKTAGLSHDDHLMAKKVVRDSLAPAEPVAAPTPGSDLHQSLTRVLRAKDPEDVSRRVTEFQDALSRTTAETPDTKARVADTFQHRSEQAGELAQSLTRIRDASDYAKSVTEELRTNLAGKLVSGDQVGIDPRTNRPVVQPENEDEAVNRPGGEFFVSALSHEERQYLNIVRGNMVGGSTKSPRYKLSRDPETGKPNMPAKMAPDEKAARLELANTIQGKLNTHFQEVWAQGGVPTPEQRSEGTNLISLLQSTTGRRLLYSGKQPFAPTTDPQSIAPGRAWMNWAMRRPATSHFAKPSTEQLNARIEELTKESSIANLSAGALRRSLPPDHVAYPDAPKVVATNGSGESAASQEAINRAQTAAPIEHVDTRSGIARPVPKGVDAVDVKPQPYEVTMQDGVVLDRGSKAGPVPVRIKRYDMTGKLVSEGSEQVAAPQAVKETPESLAAKRGEISSMRVHLANLELQGKAGTSTAVRLRQAIQAYESVLGPSEPERGLITNTASAMIREEKLQEQRNAPKQYLTPFDNSHEGKGDDLVALLATGEDIPRALHGAILKLHDLTPEDDRDYLAHAAMTSGFPKGIAVVAQRYAGALQVLRNGLKAGKGPQALQDASRFAQTGTVGNPRTGKPGDPEAGFISVPQFIPDIINELGKYASNARATTTDVVKWAGRWLSQGTYANVSETSRNAMFKFRGELNRIEDLGRVAFNDGLQAIDVLPTAQQLQLMANAQKGQPLPTQDLQGLREILQQLQDKHYVEMRSLRPSLNYWRDHIGTIWEKAPNNAASLYENHAQVVNHANLQGDKGMLRQRVYETVLDGIKHGGVPATTNLFRMALIDLGRQAQFIHANSVLFPALRAQGRLVRGETEASNARNAGTMPNPVRVPDNIVATWFPVETAAGGTVMAKGASHYMESGELKMLQNWLSKDFVRNNVVGKTLLDFKNIYTPIELFGPFHLASIVAKSAALGITQGMNRAFNVGVAQNSLSDAIGGLGEALTGLALPYTAYKNGRALREAGGQTLVAWQKYNYDKNQFLATPAGQRLSAVIPNIESTIEGLLEGGSRLDVNPDYATKWRQSLVQSWVDRKFIKAAAMVPFAALEKVTSQLFSKYIPAVKLFAAAKEINVELARNAPMIQSGETTREAVMQAAVRRVDNILGELNWDNLNASKGMRSLAMLTYRSPSWRMGTVDMVKNAIQGQAKEFYQAAARQRIPTIDPNLLYIMSSLAVGAAFATLIMSLMAHKAPASITDLTNPQAGQLDSRGKPIRLDLPLYTSRDIPEILTNPFGYASGGQTGFVSKTVEAAKNRTYQGGLVSENTGFAGVAERTAHALTPVPFGYTGYQRLKSQGFPAREGIALNVLGLNPSRRDLDMTPAESVLSDAERRFSITRDAKETIKLQAKQSIQGALLNNRFDDLRQLELDALRSNTLSFKEIEKAVDDAQKPYLVRMASGSAVRPKDLLKAYQVGTESERRELMPFVWKSIQKDPKAAKAFQEELQK